MYRYLVELTKFNYGRAASPSATLCAGSYYREMRSIAAKAAMPHLPNAISYIGARARVKHAHARICKSYYRVTNKNDR